MTRTRNAALNPDSSNPTRASNARFEILLWLILIGATIMAYANSFAGVFLFDDNIRIVDEERVHRLWPLASLLTGERPVVDLSIAVNYALGRLNPWGYHAFNLAIHILAGLALFGVVRRTIDLKLKFGDRQSKSQDERNGNSIANRKSQIDSPWVSCVAFAVALIFLVHPLQTQSVTYIIQRGESMMGFFYLLTLYCAIRAIDAPRKWLWNLAAVAACALGMSTKAIMVTAPLMVILYDWTFVARCEHQSRTYRRRWPLYLGLCSTWAILWLCGIAPEVLGATKGTSHVGFSYRGVSALQYAATQPGVILKYIQLALWPAGLCLDYDWPVATGWQPILLPSIAILVLLAITARLLYRRHWLGFVGAWFFVILAPTSSIVPIKDIMFEHRMYLPLAAIIAAIIVPIGLWLSRPMGNRPTFGNSIDNRQSTIANPSLILTIALIVAFAAPLAYATHLRNRVYHSELAMWQDVVAKRPGNARAYIAVGNALAVRNELVQALEAMRESTRINPKYADGHCSTGIILSRMGQSEEAISSYWIALSHDPGHSRAWFNLGNALDRVGRYDEAVEAYGKSIEFNARFADAHCNLGNTLMRQGKAREAIDKFRETIAVDPRHAKGHNNLGDALAREGQLDEARTEFEEAIRIQPDYVKARINLALLHRRRDEFGGALDQCHAVLKIDPANPAAQELVNSIESQLGK